MTDKIFYLCDFEQRCTGTLIVVSFSSSIEIEDETSESY